MPNLLVTRTDKRGVILAANACFQEISGFDWDELKGAPHKIVRHPDMPRAVFHIMWSMLERGKACGAYVKNKTKAGGHYWVFASVVPTDDGFMSVRVPLTDSDVSDVEPVYAAIRAREEAEGLSPEDSAALLVTTLQSHGYYGYSDFMCRHAGRQLVQSRQGQTSPTLDRIRLTRDLMNAWDEASAKCRAITGQNKMIQSMTLNMRIVASQMGGEGEALAAVSSNFRDLAEQLRTYLATLAEQISKLARTMRKSLFMFSLSYLMEEAGRALTANGSHGGTTQEQQALLNERHRAYEARGLQLAQTSLAGANQFGAQLGELRRYLSALGMTRVMSSIERAVASEDAGKNIDQIVERLASFQEDTARAIADVGSQLTKVQTTLSQIVRDRGHKAA